MPELTTPPLIGGASQAVSGRVVAAVTAPFADVTTTPQSGYVRGGLFYGEDGDEPFVIPATPEGVGLRIVLELDTPGTRGRGHVVSRTVTVPDAPTVAWGDLVDVVPVVEGGDYIVPPWAATVLAARDEVVDALGQGVITDVAAELEEGGAWAVELERDGGGATFRFTVPPAFSHARGSLPNGIDLTAFATLANVGSWWSISSVAATITGWPAGYNTSKVAQVTVEWSGLTGTIRVKQLESPYEEWIGTYYGSTWRGWTRATMLGSLMQHSSLPSGANLQAFISEANAGSWWSNATVAASVTGWPPGFDTSKVAQVDVTWSGLTGTIRVKHLEAPHDEWVGLHYGGSWRGWRREVTVETQTSVPSWAGVVDYSSNGPLYNGGAWTLLELRDMVRRGLAGEDVHLVAVGDSKTFGVGVLAAGDVSTQSWPAQLARLLGARPGIIYASNIGHAPDRRWTFSQMSAGYLGVAATGSAPAAQITVDEAHTGFSFTFLSSTAGTVSVSVDGGAAIPFAVPGDGAFHAYEVTGLPDTAHTVVWDFSAVGNSTFTLRGYRPIYATPGLTITNAGVGGSTAADWRTSAAATSYWQAITDGLDGIAFDAAFVGLGTNVPEDTTNLAGFYTDLAAVIPTIVAVSPGGVPSNRDVAAQQIYQSADALDLPLIDFRVVIGSDTEAVARGYTTDSVHESVRGYSLEAAEVARVLRP